MSAQIFSRISVIGLGYIGLPTAAMFASRKIEVVGIDVNEETVNTVNRGEVHIVEPDLDLVVRAVVKEGYLRAATVPEPAEAFLIAVPTPFKSDSHEPDLRYIEAACKEIAPVLSAGNLVVLESTSPVGTTEAMAKWLAIARPDLSFPQDAGENSDIRIAHCPERVLPGKVMQELITNDRLIGGLTQRCSELAARLYGAFVTGECVIATGPRVVEMAKLTENSFRDVNIAFANELSLICDKIGLDVWELLSHANRHPRVNILQPGPGVGGHCIAVDPWFIISTTPNQAHLIRAAREVNLKKTDWVIAKIKTAIQEVLEENINIAKHRVKVAIYGLSYKPNVDDLRESPALEIAIKIHAMQLVELIVVEPNIQEQPLELNGATLVRTPGIQADVHVMLVNHKEFINMGTPKGKIIDTNGSWRSI